MDPRATRLFGTPRHTAMTDLFVVVQGQWHDTVGVARRGRPAARRRRHRRRAVGGGRSSRRPDDDPHHHHADGAATHRLRRADGRQRPHRECLGGRGGDVLELTPSPDAQRRVTPTVVSISGTYEPLDATTDVWAAEPRMLGIAKIPFGQGETKDQAALVAPLSSYAAVADGVWRIPRGESPTPSPAFDHSWRYRIDEGRIVRTDAAPIRSLLVTLETNQDVWLEVPERPTVITGLATLLDRYDRDVAVTDVLTSFVTGGVTALAVLVLGLTALVGADRRVAEVRLLRSRGASTGVVLGLVAAWTSALGVPAALLAWAVTALALPGPVPRATLVEVALVVLLPLLAAVAVTWRRLGAIEEVPDETRDLGRAARRVVLEVVVIALAVSAVTTVRSRGGVIAAGRTDWFATVTPVLVALAASVLAIRFLPWPVGLMSRLAARGKGLVAYLGLTRAARTGASAAVPITALVVGTTLVALMSTLSATVEAQRDLAAYRAVGADARVDAARIDPGDVEGLASRAGVTAALPALVERSSGVVVDGKESLVTVLAVDPVAYEAALRGTPVEVDLPSMAASGDALPVVLSGGPGAATFDLVVRGTTIPARRAGTVPGLVRALGGREGVVALVPLDALTAAQDTTQPNTVLLKASSAAQADAGQAGEDGPVRDRWAGHGCRHRRRAHQRGRRPRARRVRRRRLPRRDRPGRRADAPRPPAPPRHDPSRPHAARHPAPDPRPPARRRATAGVGRGHAPARHRCPRRGRRRRPRPRRGLGRPRPRPVHRGRSPPAHRAAAVVRPARGRRRPRPRSARAPHRCRVGPTR